jgi:hypothetical protein
VFLFGQTLSYFGFSLVTDFDFPVFTFPPAQNGNGKREDVDLGFSRSWTRIRMPHEVDDFTIPLHDSTDMGACDLKVYSDLDRLWRMVDRYKMTPPISIRVVDSNEACIRAISGKHDHATGWHLNDEASVVTLADGSEFPMTLRVRDARGNILKMRLQREVARPKAR